MQRIGSALADDAVISLYGCETGSGTEGRSFVDGLARATGADVAASSTIVGAAALGGGWDLDIATGDGARLFASPSSLAAYPGLLAVNFTKGVIDPIGSIGPFEPRLKVGDFDGDGDTDILFQNGNVAGAGFGYFENNGNGTFTRYDNANSPGTPFATADFSGQQMAISDMLVVDYDGDGDLDIIDRDISGAGNTLGAWRNDNGTFTRVADPLGASGAFPSRMVFGDFDSDGDVDAFYQNGNVAGAGFGYFKNDGGGSFTDFTDATAAGTPFAGFDFSGEQLSPNSLIVVDYDLDGDVDIIDRNSGGGLGVWIQGSDSGGDGSPPTLASTTPSDNATNVAPDANLVITFDEAVTKGSGNIEIVRLSDGVVVATIAVTSGQVTGSGTTWTINPPANLAALTGYGVRIEAGAFVDLDGAIFFGLDDETRFSFTTGTLPPVIANLNGDTVTFTENGPAVLIDSGSNATLSDGDSANLSGGALTVSIATNENVSEDVLGLLTSGAVSLSAGVAVGSVVSVSGVAIGVISADGNGGDDLVVTFNANATLGRVQELLRALTYSNADGLDPSTAARGIHITLSDGTGGVSTVQTVTVNVSAVNDAPVVTLPSGLTANEDVATPLTGISFADPDHGGGNVTVTLSVPSGALAATGGGGVAVGGTASALTLTGSIANINTFIANSNVRFTTATNATGDVVLTVTINDGGNTGGGALTDSGTVTIDVTAVNDAPVVTTSGGTTASNEGTPAAVDAGLTLSDIDDTALSSAAVSISGGFVSGQDVLAFTRIPATMGDIVLDNYNSATGVLTLESPSGTATLAQWQAALRAVIYTNSSDTPGTGNRTISFVVNDGALNSLAGTKTVSVAAVNDAPVVTLPSGLTANEDAATSLTGISFADVDAGSASVTVTLAVPTGTLAAITGGGVTVGGTASALTLTGSIANINAFIAGSNVSFTTAANAAGDVVLTVTIDDGGNSGGAALTDSGTVTIDVVAVNDAPTVLAPGSIPVTEDVAKALTGISFADIDAGSADVSVTLAVVSGRLAATAGSGVGVAGSGSGTLTLTGSIADINAFILASGVSFTTAVNATGNVVLDIEINDGGNTGGGALTATTTVTLDVTAVNDAPVNSMPAAQATNEDTALVFSSGNSNRISISDVDAGSGIVSVTLAASNGLLTLQGTTGLSFSDGDGTNDGIMTFTGTIADINAALDGLTFIPTPGYSGPASLQITTNDQGLSGGSAQSDTDTVTIDVTPQNDAPVLTLPASATFLENTVNAAPQLLVTSSITVSDAEGFAAGGRLTISGMLAEDIVSIRNQGSATGQIGYNAATGAVSYGGVRFGTASTVSGSFVIGFDTAVSEAALEALIANLTYANSSNTPTASRVLSLLLNDGIENGAPATISVGVTPQNDAPSDLTAGPLSIAELAANGAIVGTIGAVDADG
ncbi:beta strand repeat-containing protein, partial [Rhizobiaceae sp. 2RAB30]